MTFKNTEHFLRKVALSLCRNFFRRNSWLGLLKQSKRNLLCKINRREQRQLFVAEISSKIKSDQQNRRLAVFQLNFCLKLFSNIVKESSFSKLQLDIHKRLRFLSIILYKISEAIAEPLSRLLSLTV